MKKRIEISLEYKLYEAIQKLCEYNGIEIEKYIEEAVADKYYIFKYGDLNEKIKTKENLSPQKDLPPTEAPTEVPKKKAGKKKTITQTNETAIQQKETATKRRIIIAK